VLEYYEIDAQSADVIQQSLSKMGRRAIKLYREKEIDSVELQETNAFIEKVEKRIVPVLHGHVRKIQEAQIPISQALQDNQKYGLSIPTGKSPSTISSKTKDQTLKVSPQLQTKELIAETRRKSQMLQDKRQFKEAQCLILETFERIPSSLDPYWISQVSEEELRNLSTLMKNYIEAERVGSGNLSITSTCATVCLKSFAISIVAGEKFSLPKELIEYFACSLFTVLQISKGHFRPMSPWEAETYRSGVVILERYSKTDNYLNLKIELSYSEEWAYLYNKEFETVRDILQDPHTAYLKEMLEKNPKLKQKVAEFLDRIYSDYVKKHSLELMGPMLATNIDYLSNLPDSFASLVQGYLSCVFTFYIATGQLKNRSYYRLPARLEFFSSFYQKPTLSLVTWDWSAVTKANTEQSLLSGIYLHTHDNLAKRDDLDFVNVPDLSKYPQGQNSILREREVKKLSQGDEIAPLEVQQLLSNQLYSDLSIPMWIKYFSEHAGRLTSPVFSVFLSVGLFRKSDKGDFFVIEEVMKENSLVKDCLFEFFQSHILKTRGRQWLDVHMHLIRVYMQVLLFASAAKVDVTREVAFLAKHLMGMIALTDKPITSKEDKEKILSQIVAFGPYCLWNPKLDQLCFEAYLSLNKLSLSLEKTSSTQVSLDFQRAERNFLSRRDVESSRIPRWVLLHADFPYKSISNTLKTANGQFSFDNEFGQRTFLAIDGNHFHIYRKFITSHGKEEFFELVKRSPFDPKLPENHPCSDGVLVENTKFWYCTSSQECICTDREEKRILCKIDKERIRHPENPSLSLSTAYTNPPPLCARVFAFYLAKETLIWKNTKNEIVQITIPKLSLTFTREVLTEGKMVWMASNPPGYYLDSFDRHAAFEPFSHYLMLRNKEGSRVLLGLDNTISPFKPKFPSKVIPETMQLQFPSLLLYTVEKSGNIEPPETLYESLYLVYLFLKKQDYKQAQAMIRNIKREGFGWDEKSCELLEKLDSKNQHPAAASIRIQLILLWQASTSPKLLDSWIFPLLGNYNSYIRQLNNTFEYRLSLEEEKQCLKIASTSVTSPIIAARQQFLANSSNPPKIVSLGTIYEIEQEKPEIEFTWLTSEIVSRMQKHVNNPLPLVSSLRPGTVFIANFLYYYKVAKDVKHPHHKRLLEVLRTSRFDVNKHVQALRVILITVAHNPEKYLSIEKLCNDLNYVGNFKSELEKIYNDYTSIDLNRSPITRDWFFSNKFKPRENISAISVPSLLRPTESKNKTAVPRPIFQIEGFDLVEHLAKLQLLSRVSEETQSKQIAEEVVSLNELQDVYGSLLNSDPCTKRVCQRILDGIEEKKASLQVQTMYVVNLENRKKLMKWISDFAAQIEGKAEERKNTILGIFKIKDPILQAEQKGKILRTLRFEEILLAVSADSDALFYEAHPGITLAELHKLKEEVSRYLIAKTQAQLFARALSQLAELNHLLDGPTKMDPNSHAVRSHVEMLTQTLCTKRSYASTEDLDVLLFEYFSDKRLFPPQYQAYQELANPVSFENIELEAPTGFGKSSVLIVLWLLKMSRHRTLVMKTLPASLLVSAQMILRKILGLHFDKHFLVIQFERSQASNLDYLRRLNKSLLDAKGKIILCSIDTLHRLCNLQLKQSLHDKEDDQVTEELIAIRRSIMEKVANFIDESKESLDIRQRFDYALGAPIKVSEAGCKQTMDIFRMLLTEDILAKYNFEFLPQFASPRKISITKENYTSDLLPILAKRALVYLNFSAIFPESREKSQAVQRLQAIGSHLGSQPASGTIHELATKDLLGQKLTKQEREMLTAALKKHPELHSKFDKIQQQLTRFLPQTLTRNYKEHYGLILGAQSRSAKPLRYGVPKLKSEFSTVEELKDFTIQANLREPLRDIDVKNYLHKLTTDFMLDPESTSVTSKYKLYKQFAGKLKLPEIGNFSDAAIVNLLNFLNNPKNLTDKMAFIEVVLLSEVTYFKKKVTSSPFQVIRAQHQVHSASGTVEPDTLPKKMKTKEKKSTPIDNLVALWKSSQDKVHIITSTNILERVRETLQKDLAARVLIDGGGTFRDLSSLDMAQHILKLTANQIPPVQGVSFFDENGKRFILHRNHTVAVPAETSSLQPSEVFVVIRQYKAIGSEVPMQITAKALVTVSRTTPHDFFVQMIGRMRKLKSGQKLQIVTPREESDVMLKKLRKKTTDTLLLRDTLQHSCLVQGDTKGKDNFFAVYRCLEDIVEEQLWKHLKTNCSVRTLREVFFAMESLLVKSTEEEDSVRGNEEASEVEIHEAVKRLKSGYFKALERLQKEHPKLGIDIKKIEQEFDAYVDYDKLPFMVMMGTLDEQEAVVEAEEENIAENEIELEQVLHAALPGVNYTPKSPTNWDGNYIQQESKATSSSELGIKILEFPNMNQVTDNVIVNQVVRKPGYQYLIIRDRNSDSYSYMPLDLYDARAVFTYMKKHGGNLQNPSTKDKDYLFCSGDAVLAFDGSNSTLDSNHPEIIKIRILNKIQCGIAKISLAEERFLQIYLRDQNIRKSFIEFIEKYSVAWPHMKDLLEKVNINFTSSIRSRL
ncbi:MAG: DUF3638 domain-containing protein, partial [Chlamydiae bacterium]|nr:DUF3638 domain-containing protein [Chlamydiota bacterium]